MLRGKRENTQEPGLRDSPVGAVGNNGPQSAKNAKQDAWEATCSLGGQGEDTAGGQVLSSALDCAPGRKGHPSGRDPRCDRRWLPGASECLTPEGDPHNSHPCEQLSLRSNGFPAPSAGLVSTLITANGPDEMSAIPACRLRLGARGWSCSTPA